MANSRANNLHSAHLSPSAFISKRFCIATGSYVVIIIVIIIDSSVSNLSSINIKIVAIAKHFRQFDKTF